MKLYRPIIQRQIISKVMEGEHREFVIAEWPDGEPLPATVVQMIMETWTPDGSWVEKDGSILYVQERRARGRAFKVDRYPLIVVDPYPDGRHEVLYGVEAMGAAKQSGRTQLKAHIIDEADGFPPKGQRKPVAGTERT